MQATGLRAQTSHLPLRVARKRKDMFTEAKRSEIMARIRSKNSRLDLAMEALLHKARLRFVMYPKIYGKPDFLVGHNLALFCDSGFWHGRNWRRLRKRLQKGSNSSYWITHIATNRSRDREVNAELRKQGYNVVRLWSNEVFKEPDNCLARIASGLKGGSSTSNQQISRTVHKARVRQV